MPLMAVSFISILLRALFSVNANRYIGWLSLHLLSTSISLVHSTANPALAYSLTTGAVMDSRTLTAKEAIDIIKMVATRTISKLAILMRRAPTTVDMVCLIKSAWHKN